ncbi:MAG: hypothetical protein HZB70_01510 [Candidatus Berkelbacteria bacterium]|nr:MAG: hypothetical protein HZB70_01510 [Candidatus Berkelbacteria bacterium]QQG51989.1 MAG: hypothetical protein HY845_01485 [Candidatus Berkelbacteria bacterium]
MIKHDVSHFPTILVFNTTEKDKTSVALIKNGSVKISEKSRRAQELQSIVEELIDNNHIEIGEIKAVAVLEGPGSYTGIRIGATTGNTLHWLYRMPVIVIPGTDISEAAERLMSGEEFDVTTYFSPRD